MNTQHTPGPWKLAGTSIKGTLADGSMCVIAQLYNPTKAPASEFIPNGRLIAAALDLLAALQRINRTSVQETFHGDVARFQEWLDAFTAEVIARATGNAIPTPAVSENLNQPL